MLDDIIVIFDLDGVAVDTVDTLFEIYIEVLRAFNANGNREEFGRLNGLKIDEIVALLKRAHGLPISETILKEKFLREFDRLYTRASLTEGFFDTLNSLRRPGIRLALASSAARANIETLLKRFDLEAYFDFIASGDDVASAKPSPDLYNLVREHLAGRRYYAVEDSEYGVLSALRAGMTVVLFNPGGQPGRTQASYEITRFSELERIIMVLEDRPAIVAVAGNIEIRLSNDRLKISVEEERLVNEIWRLEKEKLPTLFNGGIVNYQSHELIDNKILIIYCHPVEYKYFMAQLNDPRLQLVQPVCVSGIVMDKRGRVLIGKRSDTVTEYKGYYELVPSGGITPENAAGMAYVEQLITELRQETGVSSANIKETIPLCLIFDKQHRVFDICVQILMKDKIHTEALRSEEYVEFVAVHIDSLGIFGAQHNCVPTTAAIIEVLLLNRNP